MAKVVIKTRTEKRNVQIGSTMRHSGCKENNIFSCIFIGINTNKILYLEINNKRSSAYANALNEISHHVNESSPNVDVFLALNAFTARLVRMRTAATMRVTMRASMSMTTMTMLM